MQRYKSPYHTFKQMHWHGASLLRQKNAGTVGFANVIACFYAYYVATCYDDDDDDDAGDEESLMMGNSLMSQRRTIGV